MKKVIWLILFLLCSSAAFANPIVSTMESLFSAATIVIFFALIVETSAVTILLWFFDMSVKPVYFTFFIGNLTVFLLVFLPVIRSDVNWIAAEWIAVLCDSSAIKIISLFDLFQEATFKSLKWRYVLLVSVIGNIVSYYVGAILYAG